MSEVKMAQSDEELGRLQSILLKAVLRHEPLPGSDRAVELPDLAMVQEDGVIRVSTENLLGSLPTEDLSIPMRAVSPESLGKEACEHGDVKYLAFRPVEREETRVRLTLEGRIATCNSRQQPLGLSGLQVEFHQVDDHWEVVAPPAAFAM